MKPYLILAVTLLGLAAALIFFRFTPQWLLDEGGMVETATVILYAGLAAAILYFRKMSWAPGNYFSALIVLMLMFRELDFHTAFTTMGIFKTKFYVSADVPGLEKVIVSGVVLSLLTVLGLMLWHYRGTFISGLVKLKRPQWGIFAALGFAGVSKVLLDGLPRKLKGLGLSVDDYFVENYETFEEVLEFGIPIALIMALYYLVREKRA